MLNALAVGVGPIVSWTPTQWVCVIVVAAVAVVLWREFVH